MHIIGSNDSETTGSAASISQSLGLAQNDSTSETIEQLLQRVLKIQHGYADQPVHSYEEFVRLIRTCDLKPFKRAGPLEKIYQQEFLPRLKSEYGSTADYLLKRLDWSRELITEAQASGRYFTRDIEDKYVRVRQNDWAYSVPKDYTHWLVWTLLPLVDWKKAIPFVQEHGLAGRFSPQRPDLRIETEGYKTEEVCQEIEAFAKSHWPEATDVLWLVNPVKLQSVPALVSRVDHTSYDYVGILADGAGWHLKERAQTWLTAVVDTLASLEICTSLRTRLLERFMYCYLEPTEAPIGSFATIN